MAVVAFTLSLAGPAPTGFLSEALREMTLIDWVNLVRYHRRLFTIVDVVRYAHAESKRRFPNDPQAPNGKGNAFKHALWSALLSAEINEKTARRITDGHEDWPGNPANEKAMDLQNNRVGVGLGVRLRGRKRLEIENAVMKALRDGELRYLKSGRLVPTDK